MLITLKNVYKIYGEGLESEVRALVTAMRQTGASKESALALVETLWEEGEKDEAIL